MRSERGRKSEVGACAWLPPRSLLHLYSTRRRPGDGGEGSRHRFLFARLTTSPPPLALPYSLRAVSWVLLVSWGLRLLLSSGL